MSVNNKRCATVSAVVVVVVVFDDCFDVLTKRLCVVVFDVGAVVT